MNLQPGPFLQLSQAYATVQPGVYNFTDDALDLQGELNALGVDFDALIPDMIAMSEEPSDIGIGIVFPTLIQDIVTAGSQFDQSFLGDTLVQFQAATDQLDTAIAFAPSQAWTDPTTPFIPPDGAFPIAAPQVNPQSFEIAPNITVGTVVGADGRLVSLANTTRVGSPNFVVGDGYQVLATGKPGDDVYGQFSQNGQRLPDVDFGQIDSSGQKLINGTQQPDAVGAWSQQWYVGGELMASFNFVVTP